MNANNTKQEIEKVLGQSLSDRKYGLALDLLNELDECLKESIQDARLEIEKLPERFGNMASREAEKEIFESEFSSFFNDEKTTLEVFDTYSKGAVDFGKLTKFYLNSDFQHQLKSLLEPSFFKGLESVLLVEDKLEEQKKAMSVLEGFEISNIYLADNLKDAVKHVQNNNLDAIVSDRFYPMGSFENSQKLKTVLVDEMEDAMQELLRGGYRFVDEVQAYFNRIRNAVDSDEIPSGSLLAMYALNKDIPVVIVSDESHHGFRGEPLNKGGIFRLTPTLGKDWTCLEDISRVGINKGYGEFEKTHKLAIRDSTYE